MLARSNILQLKRQLEPLGQKVPETKLLLLLRKTRGDVDLALTALLLRPRPEWLERLVGPSD